MKQLSTSWIKCFGGVFPFIASVGYVEEYFPARLGIVKKQRHFVGEERGPTSKLMMPNFW